MSGHPLLHATSAHAANLSKISSFIKPWEKDIAAGYNGRKPLKDTDCLFLFLFRRRCFGPKINENSLLRRDAMIEYKPPITIMNEGLPAEAALKVIRLPTSWYAVIWESRTR